MGLQIRRVSKVRVIATLIAVFALVAQPLYGLAASQTANAATTVSSQAELISAVAGSEAVINLGGSFTTTSQVNINRTLTLNGNGHVISPAFTSSPSNDSVIGVVGGSPTINDVVINGVAATQVQGIQVWNSSATLNRVESKDNDKAGIHVNNSTVTVNTVKTSNNGANYGGLMVSGGVLTIAGVSQHAENKNWTGFKMDVYRTGGVVNDASSQYTAEQKYLGVVSTGIRTLKPIVAPATPVLLTPANGALINTNDFWFDWTDVVGATQYEIQASQSGAVDGNGALTSNVWSGDFNQVQPTESRAHSVGASGTWYWQVRAVNAAGLKSPWTDPWSVLIDTVAPTKPVLVLKSNGAVIASGAATKYAPVSISWNQPATDVVKYDYQYWNTIPTSAHNGEENAWLNTGITATSYEGIFNQGEGVNYLRVRAHDAAGNVSQWSDAFEVVYDKTKPVVTGSTESATNPANFTVTANDNIAVAKVTANIYTASDVLKKSNSSTANPYTIDLSTLAEGQYYVKYNAADRAGNVSNTEKFYFTVDHTAPVVTITSASRNADGTYTISGTGEQGAPVTVKVNGSSLESVAPDEDGKWTAKTAKLNDGLYEVVASSVNGLGNEGTSDVFKFTATTPVVPVVTTPVDGSTGSGLSEGGLTLLPSVASLATTISTPPTRSFLGVPVDDLVTNNETQQASIAESPEILGARDVKNNVAAVSGPVTATESGWKLFGLAWYWWLVALAAIASIWWFIAAWRRRKSEDQPSFLG